MTTNAKELKPLADLIELSSVGLDNALTEFESSDLAKLVLGRYLIVEKDQLPEAKTMDTMIYAGSQAVSVSATAADTLERALSLLAAASALQIREDELKAEKAKEEREILAIINEFTNTSPRDLDSYESLTNVEILAAREIKKLRSQLAQYPLAG